jgi:ABC-type nitrate/sulfonate/bicarbonate transport system permease component
MTVRARFGYGALGVLALLTVMQLAVVLDLVSANSMPTATSMLGALANLAVSSTFLSAVGATLLATLAAFALAALVGIPLGILLGASRLAERLSSGLIEVLRPIPAIALLPVAILGLGIGFELKVALAGFAALWPLLINSVAGVRDTDAVMVRTGRSFTWSGLAIMRRIQLPAALPFIVSGARQSISVALVIVVTLELLGARGGIGDIVRQYSAAGRIDYVFAGVVATGLLGLALHAVLAQIERRLMSWAPQYRKVSR